MEHDAFRTAARICKYKSKVTINYPNGNTGTWNGKYVKGCSSGTAFQKYGYFGYVPKGSKVCGTFYVGGKFDGKACNKIG